MPVVFDGRCFATVKLVCPPDESEQRFESLIKVLDALVRDFVIAEAGFLGNVQHHGSFAEEASDAGAESVTKDPSHPLVVRAIRYIEANLSSPQLTVGQVAQSLAVNANYLSTVFRSDVGQRMGRFIALRRMEMARGLLATTDLQIKHVALDTGHANPNWFAGLSRVRRCFASSVSRTITALERLRRLWVVPGQLTNLWQRTPSGRSSRGGNSMSRHRILQDFSNGHWISHVNVTFCIKRRPSTVVYRSLHS